MNYSHLIAPKHKTLIQTDVPTSFFSRISMTNFCAKRGTQSRAKFHKNFISHVIMYLSHWMRRDSLVENGIGMNAHTKRLMKKKSRFFFLHRVNRESMKFYTNELYTHRQWFTFVFTQCQPKIVRVCMDDAVHLQIGSNLALIQNYFRSMSHVCVYVWRDLFWVNFNARIVLARIGIISWLFFVCAVCLVQVRK